MARQEIFGEIMADPHNENYKQLFDKVFQLSGAVNPIGEPIHTLDELKTKYPRPTVGDAAYVINDKIIYRWNGKEWQYFSDLTILNDVIDDVNAAKDATELATDNANTAVVNAYQKIGEMDALKDTLNTNESTRQTNENNRKSAETVRAQAESDRLSAEGIRNANESTRVTAESSRIAAEDARQTSELSRTSAESDRVFKENQRISAENTRINNEDERKSNENMRKTNESTRESSEQSRVLTESERVSAENIRKSAENIRTANENTRINNENDRIQRMQELEDIDAVALDTKIETHLADYANLIDAFNTKLRGETGYQKLPSGLIIQWGQDDIALPNINTVYTKTVNLPIAFPNYKMFQAAWMNTSRPDTRIISQTVGAGRASFEVHGYRTSVSGDLVFRWLAIGD